MTDEHPRNVFAEVEQAAFSPANIVPGIGYSLDKILQARLFSYGDAQQCRLGVNQHQIPVNAPKCPFHSYHRNGAMRTDGNRREDPRTGDCSGSDWPSDQARRWRPPRRMLPSCLKPRDGGTLN